MRGLRGATTGAVALGALNTLGDFVWARFIPAHQAVFGLAHGMVLLLALGLCLGLARGRPAHGALLGALIGLLAALVFYTLAPLLGHWAMLAAWAALWAGFAWVDARLRGGAPPGETLTRGSLAAVGSGLAFYLVSGIWTAPAPGGPRYALHLLYWTLAFAPGLAALLVELPRTDARRGGRRDEEPPRLGPVGTL